jgi:uncharacterized membrane protein YdjX (TVP38/TMEM64 family)
VARLTLLALLLATAAGSVLLIGPRPEGNAPLFLVLYALGTLAFLPKPALSIAAGALFGAGPGLLLAAAGTTIGALLGFTAGRVLGRDALRPALRAKALASLEQRLTERPFTGVLLLRLLPVLPFAAVNLGAALTRMPWVPFAAATLLGTLPGNVLYTLAGASATTPSSPALWLPAAAGLVLLAAARHVRHKRRAAPSGSVPASPGPPAGGPPTP